MPNATPIGCQPIHYRDIEFCDKSVFRFLKEAAVPARLKDQICYTLYATSMAVNRLYKPMLDRLGITYPQYLVLNALGEEDGLTVGHIAERLALESSTVTPLVKRLEQGGLVARQRSRTDERLVQVSLTETGRTILAESDCLNQTLFQRSGMTGDELGILNHQLQTLRDLLDRERAMHAGPDTLTSKPAPGDID